MIGSFTHDQKVIDAFNSAFPFYLLAVFFDNMQGVNGGVIRAMGYQRAAAVILCFSIWVIMDPFAYVFGFIFDLGFTGLWMGVPFGNFFMMAGYILIVLIAPWKKLASEASK